MINALISKRAFAPRDLSLRRRSNERNCPLIRL